MRDHPDASLMMMIGLLNGRRRPHSSGLPEEMGPLSAASVVLHTLEHVPTEVLLLQEVSQLLEHLLLGDHDFHRLSPVVCLRGEGEEGREVGKRARL